MRIPKADEEIGQKFAEKQAKGANGSYEELLESAALLFADDGKRGEECGDVEQHNGGETRKEEIRRTGIGIEEKLRPHVDGERGAVLQNSTERLVQTDGVAHVYRLPGDGRIRAIDKYENLGAHLMQEAVGIVDGDLDADARFPGNDHVVEIVVVFDVLDEMKRIRVFEAIEEFAAFASAVGIVNDGVDLADVGVNCEAEEKHLEQWHGQRKEKRARVTADVKGFLVENGANTAKDVTHGWPPVLLDAYK